LKPVVLEKAAEFELDEAFLRYEALSPGLGVRFESDLERTLSYVSERPKMYPFVEGDLHRALLKDFPYGVFYRETDDAIFVVAIFGQPQDSALWSTR
jgi:plasmid stabilization system protein ParE